MALTDLRTYITVRGLVWVIIVLASLVLPLGLLTDYPMIPFGVILAVVWVALNIRYPYVGLLIYSIFILVRPNEFVSALAIPMIEKAMVAPVFLGAILKYIFSSKREFFTSAMEKSILGFVVVAFLSILTSVWVAGAWKSWFDLLRLMIIFVFVVQLINSEKQFRLFVFIFLVTGGFHAVSATIQYYRGIRGFAMGIDRAMGMDLSYGAPNSLAATIVYTLPFIYCYFRATKSLAMRAFLGAVTFACVWCIILTGSRTGMLGFGFVVFMIAMQHKNKLRNMAIGAMLVVVAFVMMPQQYKDRLSSSTDLSGGSGASQSAHGRIDGLVNGIRMAIDRPLLGVGVGQYPVALGSIYGLGWWEAHSLPGQLIGDLGLLGIIAFVVWMQTLFKGFNRLADSLRKAGKKSVFMDNVVLALRLEIYCMFFMGLGGHNLYRYNWFFATAMAAVMLKLVRDSRPVEVDASDIEAADLPNPPVQRA